MTNRRNFLRSVLAAIALSPLVCRAREMEQEMPKRYHVTAEVNDVKVADYFTDNQYDWSPPKGSRSHSVHVVDLHPDSHLSGWSSYAYSYQIQ